MPATKGAVSASPPNAPPGAARRASRVRRRTPPTTPEHHASRARVRTGPRVGELPTAARSRAAAAATDSRARTVAYRAADHRGQPGSMSAVRGRSLRSWFRSSVATPWQRGCGGGSAAGITATSSTGIPGALALPRVRGSATQRDSCLECSWFCLYAMHGLEPTCGMGARSRDARPHGNPRAPI